MMKLEKGLSRSNRILHFLVGTERHTASGLIRLNFLAKLRCKHIDKTKGSQYNRKGCIVLLSLTFIDCFLPRSPSARNLLFT